MVRNAAVLLRDLIGIKFLINAATDTAANSVANAVEVDDLALAGTLQFFVQIPVALVAQEVDAVVGADMP
ncbi:hypothetical protein D3C71_2055860 [compost metagenome]